MLSTVTSVRSGLGLGCVKTAMIGINTRRRPPSSQVFGTTACVFSLMISALCASVAQTSAPRPEWAMPTTVLTMASNGSWGAATDDTFGAALAAAIAHCNRRFREAIGCGALQTTMRAGWSFGIRCGDKNILVAEKTLREAEQAAIDREIELRRQYGLDLPPCVRVVSVDPSGAVVAPYAATLVGMVTRRREGPSR
jgi:hypothetical protein